MLKTLSEQNLKIKMEVETEFEEHRFQTFFTKEPETIDWIKTLVRGGDVFFDIGANIGVYSLFAGILNRERVKVYAFEPVYHNFAKLCRNVVANQLQNTVFPYGVAVSDRTRFETMDLASTDSGTASHLMAGAPEKLRKNFTLAFRQGIFAVTLDDLVGQFGFSAPNHLKIDVDGFEERVLGGAHKTLQRPDLRSVLIEITDQEGAKDRILEIMKGSGFATDHPLNFQASHSRVRREQAGKGDVVNIIFTK